MPKLFMPSNFSNSNFVLVNIDLVIDKVDSTLIVPEELEDESQESFSIKELPL